MLMKATIADQEISKTNPILRGVALDMDGVIIDGMKYHVKAWQETFKYYFGIEIASFDIYIMEGMKGEDVIRKIAEKYLIPISDVNSREIHKYKQAYFKKICRIEPIPGIDNLIKLLNEYGYLLAVVTGTSRNSVNDVLTSLNLSPFFRTIISGDDVTNGKPAAEPYIRAAHNLRVPIQNCLAIENAPAGISSVKSANMLCLAIQSSLNREYLQQADLIFSNLDEIKNFIISERKISGGVGEWNFMKF